MNAILEPLRDLENFRAMLKSLEDRVSPVLATGVVDSQKCHLIYGILEEIKRTKAPEAPVTLIITQSELHSKEIFEDMQFFLRDKIMLYPSKDVIFYHADVRSIEITKQRLQVLDALLKKEALVIVLSVDALMDKLTPVSIFKSFIVDIHLGDEVKMADLAEKLVLMGYERCELVEGSGQFAIRGGILDLFASTMDHAVRIEFIGDEIDSMRLLDSNSQRSIENVSTVHVLPMREFMYPQHMLPAAIAQITEEFNQTLEKYTDQNLHEEAATLRDTVSEALERLHERSSFSGVDKYMNAFYSKMNSLLDYLPENTIMYLDEPYRLAIHMDTVMKEFNQSMQNRILKGHMLASQAEVVWGYADILSRLKAFRVVMLSTLAHSFKDLVPKHTFSFDVKPTAIFKKRFDLLQEELRYWVQNHYKVLILSGTRSKGERLAKEILEHELPAHYYQKAENIVLTPGKISITQGSFHRGFEYAYNRFIVISDKELFGEEKKKRRVKKSRHSKIESFTDLKPGDYVVHDNHGIAIYKGIEQMMSDGVNKDYLKLEYQDGGILYVHTSQLDLVQKHIGSDGAQLRLNKLGGADWGRAKAKSKKAIQILARDLVALYAKRLSAPGYVYGKDTIWQQEFETAFPYEETEDQLGAIDDVKRDMESGKVMDRLICGDVGYGKTEIAIRAAFKAVQEGKQVAYLVPTTILAQQHTNTFTQRMKDYPIRVDNLSRFRTKKQQDETVKKMKTGEVDIVIGTHRLLSKDIGFKDLGMIIVDEEQRFGVSHKEKLKALKGNVDVLTLTATPIPRTLHMSLTGIRDMSVLEEPPQERMPVQTYVMEHNIEFIREAINRELARGGQVYYLNNRIKNIEDTANKLQTLIPDAHVAYAHGRMSERELENIMVDFINGDIHVLVCTTIIETGLDIANVNTIIIQNADFMGLSQLYQLRGRVGRSNRQAYAYLFYQRDKVLREVSEKRLHTIREFTEFGAGFKIAMRDMQIRGTGNLLGAEQHGHIEAIGYDLYCKLLDTAVKELQGKEVAPEFETTVDFSINAYIPSYYIKNEEQKLEIYKKISLIQTPEDYLDVRDEMLDRFGNLPPSVQNLLDIALLKAVAHSIGIVSLTHRQSKVAMHFKVDAQVNPARLLSLVQNNKKTLSFAIGQSPVLTYKIPDGTVPNIIEIRELLEQLSTSFPGSNNVPPGIVT